MGRKKKFIDKKRATTYYAVPKEEGDDGDGDYEFVSSDQMATRIAEAHAASQTRNPMAWLYQNEDSRVETEQDREEILSLGLPDDGYNYLKHTRAVGAQARMALQAVPEERATPQEADADILGDEAAEAEVAGMQEFQPPPEDVAIFDARSLLVPEAPSNEEEVVRQRDSVSAFSHNLRQSERVTKHTSVRQVAELMAAVEEFDDVRRLKEAEAPPAAVLGEGDLLDDFVVCASRAPHTSAGGGLEGDVAPHEDEEWEFASLGSSDAASETQSAPGLEGFADGCTAARRPAASIADSFWRPERSDRTYAQSILDERLIAKMDLEYNDDEIGSLGDEEEATRGCGFGDGDDRVQAAITDFLLNYRKGNEVADLPIHWKMEDLSAEQVAGLDDELVARLKAREAYERQAARQAAQRVGDDDRDLEAEFAPPPVRDEWDCESVLSLRSNLTNHPAQIGDEAAASRRQREGLRLADAHAEGGLLKLSAKTGLPVGIRLARVAEEESGDTGLQGAEEAGLNLGIARNREEAREEKKARKAAVKAAQRSAREAKKELKMIFSQEHMRAQKHAATNTSANTSVVCIH